MITMMSMRRNSFMWLFLINCFCSFIILIIKRNESRFFISSNSQFCNLMKLRYSQTSNESKQQPLHSAGYFISNCIITVLFLFCNDFAQVFINDSQLFKLRRGEIRYAFNIENPDFLPISFL